jgi:hypothetical protein
MNNLWLADYDAAADAPQWVECAIERLTPKFVWCCGAKIDRAALEADGRASSSRHDLYCVKALVPANGKRITLADQAARWERRKADILAADKAYQEAERRCDEAEKRARAVLRAYCSNPPTASEHNLQRATEAFDRAIDARMAAWDQRNRYTVREIERARNGG